MKFKYAATAALMALASPALAQNNVSEAAEPTVPAEPAATQPSSSTSTSTALPAPAPAPAPAPVASETVVTTTTTPVTVPPLEDPLDNPYANTYNELVPLEVDEDEGFDDWGLVGLLGLFGLLGLRRRERLVYVEPASTVTRTSSRTVVHDDRPPTGPIA